jgi:nucleotide-binding universal stress UspA family protein
MPTELLLAFDGSDAAEAAVTSAGALFPGAQGRVLTVFNRTMQYESVRQYSFGVDASTLQRGIEELAQEAQEAALEVSRHGASAGADVGLSLEPTVAAVGFSEWPAVLSAADEIDADAIVCGSRGRGAVARSLLGSTSTSLVHHSTRPVLVVPQIPAALDGPALLAYDGSDGARAAIERAGRLFPGRAAIVIHVWYSPVRHSLSGRALARAPIGELQEMIGDYEAMFAGAAGDVVEEGVALARDAGFDASGEAVESGAGAWRELAELADRRSAAVIVCGSRGRSVVTSALLGSVSSGLVHNAQTPTLLVRENGAPDA